MENKCVFSLSVGLWEKRWSVVNDSSDSESNGKNKPSAQTHKVNGKTGKGRRKRAPLAMLVCWLIGWPGWWRWLKKEGVHLHSTERSLSNVELMAAIVVEWCAFFLSLLCTQRSFVNATARFLTDCRPSIFLCSLCCIVYPADKSSILSATKMSPERAKNGRQTTRSSQGDTPLINQTTATPTHAKSTRKDKPRKKKTKVVLFRLKQKEMKNGAQEPKLCIKKKIFFAKKMAENLAESHTHK